MKIRIITHHTVHNHGALLQLYALMEILKKYDKTVCALDYYKNFDFLGDFANNKYNISIKSIPFYFGFLKEKGLKRTLFNIRKKIILDKFKKDFHMVGEYYSRCKDMHAVFIGSDEVFSIEPGLNPFFWGMGVPAKHIFAYGGCFGPTNLEFIREKHAVEYIKAGIERIECISVRDINSQEIIKDISGKEPIQVCDPVILYGYIREKEKFKKMISDNYLLIYAYDENMNDEKEIVKIREYAEENDLKVVSVGFYHKWCDKCINADPIHLLEWVWGAQCVVTDTFHGTVMSIIMNTQFATKIRENRNKLGYLLSEYGLEERELVDFTGIRDVFRNEIDFNRVNDLVEKKRKTGMCFIEHCMRKAKK